MIDFTGNFEHNLDSKNRLFIPAKFREQLGDKFIIRVRPSTYPHIDCFREEDFPKIIEKEVSSAHDEYSYEKKLFAARATATPVVVDSQGRITLNATLLKFAKIEKCGRFTGMGDRVQIWDPKIYDAFFMAVYEDISKDEKASDLEGEKLREFKSDGRFLELKN